jgi:hypothetical protein
MDGLAVREPSQGLVAVVQVAAILAVALKTMMSLMMLKMTGKVHLMHFTFRVLHFNLKLLTKVQVQSGCSIVKQKSPLVIFAMDHKNIIQIICRGLS